MSMLQKLAIVFIRALSNAKCASCPSKLCVFHTVPLKSGVPHYSRMVQIKSCCGDQISQDVEHRHVCYCIQLQKEAREKEETLQRMLSAEKKVRALEEDNRQLRREHSEMKKELDKMRKEVFYS